VARPRLVTRRPGMANDHRALVSLERHQSAVIMERQPLIAGRRASCSPLTRGHPSSDHPTRGYLSVPQLVKITWVGAGPPVATGQTYREEAARQRCRLGAGKRLEAHAT